MKFILLHIDIDNVIFLLYIILQGLCLAVILIFGFNLMENICNICLGKYERKLFQKHNVNSFNFKFNFNFIKSALQRVVNFYDIV